MSRSLHEEARVLRREYNEIRERVAPLISTIRERAATLINKHREQFFFGKPHMETYGSMHIVI